MIACSCIVCRSADEKDKRFRSSLLVESETTTLVIDTTPDFRSQMLINRVTRLDAVLITHHHKDHIAGLDDIKAYNYFHKQPMPVYASEASSQALQREFMYIFAENKYPGIPDVQINILGDTPFLIGDIPVLPINVWHLKMPVLGFRFGNFTYITDANRIEDSEKEKIKGSSILVLNALRHEKHISHFTLQEAIDLSNELEIPQAYFTHISHQLGKHQGVNDSLPADRLLAYDGLQLNIPASGN